MDDLISRQAAIDALDAVCDRECEYSKQTNKEKVGVVYFKNNAKRYVLLDDMRGEEGEGFNYEDQR